MSKDKLTHQLTETIEELSCPKSLKGLFHQHRDGNPLPSGKALEEIINLSRSILSPDIMVTHRSTYPLSSTTSE